MNQKIICVALIAILAANFFIRSEKKSSAFEEWKKIYSQRGWTAAEENYRKIIFQQNLDIIKKHNQDPYMSYKMGINQFSIYTNSQFVNLFLSSYVIETPVADVGMTVQTDVDWVIKGMVSPIKNQGQCGSCWAFSAIACVQSYYRFKSHNVSLSEQQLVDCSSAYGNHGCNGGSHTEGMRYVKDHGVQTQADYPYIGKTEACKKQGGTYLISTIEYAKGCTGMQNALMSRPLGVGVDATGWSHYSSGIFSNCGTSLNHAVQLVGISSSYWKVKNSWGKTWGQNGFIRLALGNTCGICNSQISWAA